MKVKIDADACIGCGLCVNTCPEVYKMEEDKAVVSATPVPQAAEADCKKAVEECPVTAIVIAWCGGLSADMDPNVLHNLSYGMYIVASNKGEALNGQIANAAMQITSEPATIAISINKKNLTHEFIEASSRFSLSILEESTPLAFIGKFGFKSGRTEDKFKDVGFKKLASGCPVVLDNSVGYVAAKVMKKFDCLTHTVFFGQITDSEVLKPGRPMTYDYYRQVKRGNTPANAPTFIKNEMPGRKADTMQKYRCVVCNYIYDPAVGDPDNDVQPGTPFEKIPDTWVCPVCGADKSQFVKSGD